VELAIARLVDGVQRLKNALARPFHTPRGAH
jgi:hypothetical protein